MKHDPETLRTYASILEKPKRDPVSKSLQPASSICLAAAEALRFMADRQ